MRTLKLTLAYDGTAYVGWQRQAQGSSVQGLVEEALARIEGRPVAVVGAGRTDAGVHALGQVASLRLDHPIDLVSLGRALNATLPADIRVVRVEQAADDFHARYSARAKTYRYRIVTGELTSPFEHRYAWHVQERLNDEAMIDAAGRLEGRHDFAAFQAAGSSARTTTRTVFSVGLQMLSAAYQWHGGGGLAESDLVTVELTGDGFLRHMVRSIVGTLVEVGAGRRPASSISELLESGDRAAVGATAPAHGLFLVRVDYDGRAAG